MDPERRDRVAKANGRTNPKKHRDARRPRPRYNGLTRDDYAQVHKASPKKRKIYNYIPDEAYKIIVQAHGGIAPVRL